MSNSDYGRITLSAQVQQALEALAENPRTVSRYWSIYDQIIAFTKKLRGNPRDIRRRFGLRSIEEDGTTYTVFVIPMPLAVISSVDTLGILSRDSDYSLHVFEHANCDSLLKHHETMVRMKNNISNTPNLSHFFLSESPK